MKKIIGILMGLFSIGAVAATSQCFEFKWSEHRLNSGKVEKRPAIVTKRIQVNGETLIISQEVVPLNESVYDTLYALKGGAKVCLKGTKGLYMGAPSFFYAFEAEVQ